MCLDEAMVVAMIGEEELVVSGLDSGLVFFRQLEPGIAYRCASLVE